MIDFTDSANPVEIAYFDRGPINDKNLVLGGYWSTYWYDGRIYGTEIARGVDVLTLQPSEHLTANEIAAARLADQGGSFNPQRQLPVSWPSASPVVARAYVDQLARNQAVSSETVAGLNAALDAAQAHAGAGTKDRQLASTLDTLGRGLGDATDARRAAALRGVLTEIAATLR